MPTFSKTQLCIIISPNLVAISIHKGKLTLNNTIYVGKAVLDLSKVLMANFHYNYMKNKYGENVKLLFTDTDSLCYYIKTKDYFENIKK